MKPLSVVTIGNFDGVHVGHAALVRAAREIAESQAKPTRVVAMTFEPHPMTRINPAAAPPRITTYETRVRLLGEAGADEVATLEPTGQVLAMSPAEFVDHVVKELNPVAIIEGPDFRFGRGRAGDVKVLRQLAAERNVELRVLKPVEVAMTDHTVAPASSSLARWLIAQGRVRDAAAVLGRSFAIEGTVERGDQRGRQLGYPTANVRTECIIPGDGVYGGTAVLPDGRELPAAISVGNKPTFENGDHAIEAHILEGPDLSKLPDYGWEITVRFDRWIREQLKFNSLDELKRAIEQDCRRILEGFRLARPELKVQGGVYA